MRITDLAINRAVTFSMIFLGVIAFGLVSLGRLNPELYPNVTFPVATVVTTYPGVGSEDIEKIITKPIEGVVSTITGIEEVTSVNSEGTSLIIIKFSWGTNMDVAASDIRERLDLVNAFLPKDASKPLIFKFDVSSQPIMFVGVSSDKMSLAELQKLSEDNFEPYLERIDGIASVSTTGGQNREIQVQLDRNKLEAYGLSPAMVMGVIGGENISSPGGEIKEDRSTKLLRTIGEFTSIDQIRNIVISYRGGAPIYVRDVAEVIDGFSEQKSVVLINGKPSVNFWIQKQADANTVKVASKATKAIQELQKKYEGQVKFNIVGDSSEFIRDSLQSVTSSAIQGGLLAIIILFFFLYSIRSVMIIGIAIPISIISTFSIMDVAGVSLNIISMAGLALGVGMLVDNAIVVLENTYRHREEGEDRRKSASNGASEVAIAITASTLTTLSVFIPVIFVPGIAGVLFKDQALTVTFSLAASLIVSLTIIPLLCSRFLKLDTEGRRLGFMNDLITRLSSYRTKMDAFYQKRLDWSFRHRKTVIAFVIFAFLASISLFYPFRLIGTEFTPAFDEGEIRFQLETVPGTRLEITEAAAREAERIINEVGGNDIDNTYISVGSGEGIAAIFSGGGSNAVSIMVHLKKINERSRSQAEIENQMRDRLLSIPGLRTLNTESAVVSSLGFGGSPINIEIYGYDREIAKDLADKIKVMVEEVKGASDIQSNLSETSPELHIEIDREKAYALGLNMANIANTIQTNVLGTTATKYREGSEEYNVIVRFREEDRLTRNDIYNIPISSPMMTQVSLGNIAKIKPADGSVTIQRKNQERFVTITGKLRGRDMGSVNRDIQAKLKTMPIPPGFTVSMGGAASDMAESFKWLGIALVGALFLVYAVMASLYESFLTPFIIMFTFPLGIIGIAWLFLFTGTTFSLTAFIGLIVLAGIVVNNGIVMIDYINQLRAKGMGLNEAVMTGARTRLRPILMTSLTTISGMFPLALGLGAGSETSFPLARAVIGGLAVSTILTLIFLPILYTILSEYRIKRAEKKSLKKSDHTSIAIGG
jgi:HAE1 family hydrophobic/amphiphilic exporter-1